MCDSQAWSLNGFQFRAVSLHQLLYAVFSRKNSDSSGITLNIHVTLQRTVFDV